MANKLDFKIANPEQIIKQMGETLAQIRLSRSITQDDLAAIPEDMRTGTQKPLPFPAHSQNRSLCCIPIDSISISILKRERRTRIRTGEIKYDKSRIKALGQESSC